MGNHILQQIPLAPFSLFPHKGVCNTPLHVAALSRLLLTPYYLLLFPAFPARLAFTAFPAYLKNPHIISYSN
jgi:hypothetical protein